MVEYSLFKKVIQLTTQEFDKSKAEEFASKIIQILNGGMLSLMISIGHKTVCLMLFLVCRHPLVMK